MKPPVHVWVCGPCTMWLVYLSMFSTWYTSEYGNEWCVPNCMYLCYVHGPEGLHICLNTLLCPGLAFWCSESGWAACREAHPLIPSWLRRWSQMG